MKQHILQDFLSVMRDAVVATVDADGTLRQTPAGVYFDGECFYFHTAADAQELRNLQRDPRLSLCISDPGDRGGHMFIRGSVIEQRMQRGSQRVFVRIEPERSE